MRESEAGSRWTKWEGNGGRVVIGNTRHEIIMGGKALLRGVEETMSESMQARRDICLIISTACME